MPKYPYLACQSKFHQYLAPGTLDMNVQHDNVPKEYLEPTLFYS